MKGCVHKLIKIETKNRKGDKRKQKIKINQTKTKQRDMLKQ